MRFLKAAIVYLCTVVAAFAATAQNSHPPANAERLASLVGTEYPALDRMITGSSAPLAVANGLKVKVGEIFKDCRACPEIVVVPAGSFRMGDLSGARDKNAKPVHRVTISRAFGVGRYEITFDQWNTCRSEGGCTHRPDDRGWGRGSLPVTDVSWEDAKAYTGWLSRKTGKSYRLLTEAEWEYVARAGAETIYPWGNSAGHNRANCKECGSSWDAKRPAPVGQFQPNGFGVHDTVGNVWEWVEDCWHKNYAGAPDDGTARTGDKRACSRRVIRGGSWYLSAWYARTAVRDWNKINVRSGNFGFRVARTLED